MKHHVLIIFLLTSVTAYASQTAFLLNRLQSTARYNIWRTAMGGIHQTSSSSNVTAATLTNNYGACQTNSFCKGDRQTGCLNISEHSREIDHKHHNQIVKNIKEALTCIPVDLQGIIVEYVAAHMVLRAHRNSSKKPIIYIHPVDSNSSMLLAGDADDKEHLAFSWNMLSNNIEEHASQPSSIIRMPKEISDSLGYSHFIDYDQSKTHLITITPPFGILIWPKGSMLERAMATGKAIRILCNDTIKSGNESFDTSYNVVRFSERGRYVAIGSVDGTVQFREIASGDCVYTIKHDASVTALAKGADENSWLVGLANGDVYEWRGYFTEPPDSKPDNQREDELTSTMDDNPQYELMTDIAPLSPEDQLNLQTVMKDASCALDCYDCTQALSCRSGFKSSCMKCCRTSASCVVSCPRFCVCCCCRRCVRILCMSCYYRCAARCCGIVERCFALCRR